MSNLTYIPQVVSFHGTELFIVEHEGQPYVPMRSVVQGMGLDWAAQFTKLKQRFATCVVEIAMQILGDDQSRAHTCLLLRKLPAWLYSIMPGKVRPELRDTVILYQQECDDVLWEYWTKGQAINQRLTISPEQQNVLHEIVDRRAGRDRSLRASMWIRHNRHFGIAKYSQLLSIHFDDAKQYLETIPLHELVPTETDTLKRLEKFVDNLAARYPALENPLAYEIAQQIGEKLKYQSPKGPKNFWISIQENGGISIQQHSLHHTPVNVVQLRERFNQLWDFLHKDEVLELGKVLKRFPFEPVNR
ncbi:phage antirepressor N-terminal domain-containing protein [Acinetobacter baumannii]|uniref:phage antirepressor N-terminal domain-containing protein n=1 Tax=Acinetobacter baumannii TaxID=470 RepID=UPI001C0526D0|nr:phage antirepressor N-terminal domain-containing protein [Acinetobacter baumannii]MBU0313907.1 phage antirepressor N-terminal domain-containing protein [Acinetobacter baumannii]MCR0059388.1 phage antirepressor N-terminal domain-containing protein [Acinetobacter baumannii]MCR0070908.1 phage antirepressor N-terminal domain-containing protein [Acinetobacter baumannii]MCR0086470.1 phage antirepressor N-terminal domain-containing protein [Acinetobacter baumannii]UMO04092.1 phage antirepressor N-